MGSRCCRARATWLERIHVGPRRLVEIVEQRAAPDAAHHVEKALLNDVLMDRHNGGLPCFDRSCIGCEPHHVKISTLFDVDPAKVGYLPSARLSKHKATLPNVWHAHGRFAAPRIPMPPEGSSDHQNLFGPEGLRLAATRPLGHVHLDVSERVLADVLVPSRPAEHTAGSR
jgi:hypothetical protein